MENEKVMFKLASLLLSYPDDELWAVLDEAMEWINQNESPASKHISLSIERMRQMDREELEHHYVNVFDFSESTCLYLTAHEYGDNRARGNAFINLRILLASEGYEQLGDELPDYLPLLFEFIGDCHNEEKRDHLKPRLAKVVAHIQNEIDSSSPYQPIFTAISELLPKPEDHHFPEREKADTGKMPYPLPFG